MARPAGNSNYPSVGLAVIQAQEDERRRIAREIHDGPAQTLAHLIFSVEICEKLLDVDVDQARQELGRLRDQLRGGLKDVRQIIYDLRPLVVEELGLFDATERYLEDFAQRTGVSAEMHVEGERRRLQAELEIGAYRLIQESLTNVAKHAGARTVEVRIHADTDDLNIEVADDGVGFHPDPVDTQLSGHDRSIQDDGQPSSAGEDRSGQRHTFGISGMRERIRALGGSFNVESAPGKGTTMKFRFPCNGY